MRRGRLEIMLDFLDQVGQGATKITHIIYRTNTSMRTTYKYMAHLMERGLIVKKEGKYVLSEAGLIALKHGVDFKWAVLP